MTSLQSCIHLRGAFRLHAENLGLRLLHFDSHGNPGNQTASSNGHQHGVKVGELFGYLKSASSSSRDYRWIIEGMHERSPRRLYDLVSLGFTVTMIFSVLYRLAAELYNRVDLLSNCSLRQDDCTLLAQ